MPSDTIKPITGLRTIGIPVTDQDRAVAFYAQTLGCEPTLDVPIGNGARWVEVRPPGTNVSLALECAREGHPAGVETGIRLTTHDADAAHAACGHAASTPTACCGGPVCRRCSPSAIRTATGSRSSRPDCRWPAAPGRRPTWRA